MKNAAKLSIFAIMLCAFFCVSHASADIPCICHKEKCTCFIQIGDEGIAVKGIGKALFEQGYLYHPFTVFNESFEQAVKHFQEKQNLPVTGMLDDKTLTLLLWGEPTTPLDSLNFVWVPTDGGKRAHIKPTCCQMLDPRLISAKNAEALGIKPCGICNK